MRALFSLFLFANMFLCSAQLSIKSQYTQSFGCYQKKGCDAYGEGYKQDFYVQVSGQQLQWRKSIFAEWTSSVLRKKTDKYVIGRKDDLYTYVDLISKSIYYIDFYGSSYQTWGLGPDLEEVAKNTTTMMEMLRDRHTQKDVMQFLIDQTEEEG